MSTFSSITLKKYLNKLKKEYKKSTWPVGYVPSKEEWAAYRLGVSSGAYRVFEELESTPYVMGKKEYNKLQREVYHIYTDILEARFGPEEDWHQDFRKVNLSEY